jgi:uncharacterized protein YeaC (DUF1315 family)
MQSAKCKSHNTIEFGQQMVEKSKSQASKELLFITAKISQNKK